MIQSTKRRQGTVHCLQSANQHSTFINGKQHEACQHREPRWVFIKTLPTKIKTINIRWWLGPMKSIQSHHSSEIFNFHWRRWGPGMLKGGSGTLTHASELGPQGEMESITSTLCRTDRTPKRNWNSSSEPESLSDMSLQNAADLLNFGRSSSVSVPSSEHEGDGRKA